MLIFNGRKSSKLQITLGLGLHLSFCWLWEEQCAERTVVAHVHWGMLARKDPHTQRYIYHWTNNHCIASRNFSELFTSDVMYLFTSRMVCELLSWRCSPGRCLVTCRVLGAPNLHHIKCLVEGNHLSKVVSEVVVFENSAALNRTEKHPRPRPRNRPQMQTHADKSNC